MGLDQRPVVVAYDGSAEAQAAVRTAAGLFAGRTLLVVSVWEPGLALALTSMSDPSGLTFAPPPTPETMAAADEAQRDHAAGTARAGVELARQMGATAEPLSVADEVNVADTIASLADQQDACAVVIGSRGLGRVKAGLLGSTSQGLLHSTNRPVLVVSGPKQTEGARGGG
jgi:nucleotide-binding universal stress UspA family protein